MKLKIAIFLLITINFYSQNNTVIDSMYYVVKTTKNDTVLANTHYELAWVLKLNNLNAATLHMDSAMNLYQKMQLPRKIALGNFQYSVLYRVGGEYTKAIQSLNSFQKYIESVKDTANLTYAFYEKGVIYSLKGDFQNSLEELYSAYSLAEATNNLDMASTILNSIGLVYNDLNRYIEAIESFEKALAINEVLGVETEHLGDVFNGLGSAYKELKNYDKTEEFFNKALENYKSSNSEFGVAIINFNKGVVFNEKEQFEKAIPYLLKAYEIQKKNDFEAELVKTIASLSEAYFDLGKFDLCEEYLEEGLQLQIENKLSSQDLYFEFYRLKDQNKNYKEALKYHEKYILFKDSIYDEENINSINYLQKQFETEKKNKEIALQQNIIQKKETQFNYLISIVCVLLLLSILLWFSFKQRQKRKNQEILALKREHQVKTLESLIEGEESERLRIAKELHDGVNGDLSAIKFKLSSLLELNNTIIKEAITMIDNSCSQVRAISHNLVPPSLENFTLIEATSAYCKNMNAVQEVAVNFQYLGDKLGIEKKIEVTIYRIIQELVSNSLKHANASEINVQISSRQSIIQITVEDNGNGFDMQQETGGIGLTNIKSRLSYLQANEDVISNSSGTSFNFEVDLKKLNEN